MRHRRRIAITVLGMGVGALAIAQAVSGEARRSSAASADSARYTAQAPGTPDTTSDDTDEQARGSDAERAARAAVAAVGGGRASAVEREDEPGVAWEVEVVQPDGTQVEVDLDRNFERVATDRDDDGASDDDAREVRNDSDDD
jgi:uncharacterized membrane protein YkoI